MENEKDELFLMLRNEVLRILRFAKKNANGEWEHENLSEEYFFNYAKKRICKIEAYKDYNEQQINNVISWKLFNIMEWVKMNYKNKEYMKKYHKKYYHEVRKIKENRKNKKEEDQKKVEANFNKVESAYNYCLDTQKKPTIANIVELSGLSKNTVNKYLKQLKQQIKEIDKNAQIANSVEEFEDLINS